MKSCGSQNVKGCSEELSSCQGKKPSASAGVSDSRCNGRDSSGGGCSKEIPIKGDTTLKELKDKLQSHDKRDCNLLDYLERAYRGEPEEKSPLSSALLDSQADSSRNEPLILSDDKNLSGSFISFAEFFEVFFELLALGLVAINAHDKGKTNFITFAIASFFAICSKTGIVKENYLSLQNASFDSRQLNAIKYFQWLVFCFSAPISLTSSEISTGQVDFTRTVILKTLITLLSELSQLLQQGKMALKAKNFWKFSQFFTYLASVSYAISLISGLCDDNLEMTACGMKVVRQEESWVPIVIGLSSSYVSYKLVNIIYHVSIAAFQYKPISKPLSIMSGLESSIDQSIASNCQPLPFLMLFICEILPRVVLANDTYLFLNAYSHKHVNIRTSLLLLAAISTIPTATITSKKIELKVIDTLIHNLNNSGDTKISRYHALGLFKQVINQGFDDSATMCMLPQREEHEEGEGEALGSGV